ncbi:MAG: DUF3352 domain-containing protein [Cyanobacteria bacterium P01_A01_bin.84]
MALPVVSVAMKKKNKPSLLLSVGSAALLIAGGALAYWLFTQGKPLSRDLPVGVNIIPQDALFTVSLTTDSKQWQKVENFGTKETRTQINEYLTQLSDRLLTSNGYSYEKDIQPWVGKEITIAVLAPQIPKPKSKPVADKAMTPLGSRVAIAPKKKSAVPIASPKEAIANISGQSLAIVLPIRDQKKASEIFAKLSKPEVSEGGKWKERTYEGVKIKEAAMKSGGKLSAAALDGKYLLITDGAKAIERSIDAYLQETSLVKTPGFTSYFPKIASYNPFARFYVNVPGSAEIAAASLKNPFPKPVLNKIRSNQGLAGTIILEDKGMRLKGVSWLNPNRRRRLQTDNRNVTMSNRVPSDTMVMLSGSNLKRAWGNYISTSEKNSLSPIAPEKLRSQFKSWTELDLDRDLLSWMNGEFSFSVIPAKASTSPQEEERPAFVFMVKASDRKKAENALQQLDTIMKDKLQFKIQSATTANKPIVNWVRPVGVVATRGWLDDDIAFLSVGVNAPVTKKIVPKPNRTLGSSDSFRKTVPGEINPSNGKFFIDVEKTSKQLPLGSLFPNQKIWLDATNSIGFTTAVDDVFSTRYDIFLSLKQNSGQDKLDK